MAVRSAIEWTESTWNPVTGCTKVTPGCQNCYAERMAKRLQAMGQTNYKNGFELTLHEKMLRLPLKWSNPPPKIFHNKSFWKSRNLFSKRFLVADGINRWWILDYLLN